MECKYCKNTFKTKSSLNTHQKTAKYCLKLRNIKVSEYKCSSCHKYFSTLTNLNRHQKDCRISNVISDNIEKINELEKNNGYLTEKIIFLQKQLSQKDEIIKDLQKQIQEIALRAVSKPTTSKTQINNYIQKLEIVTDQCLNENIENLTIDHIKKGPEGYAQYALEYPLKDRLLCVDYARRKIKFKDKDGNIITDPEMTVLAKKFFSSIKEKNKELICQLANELKERLGDDNLMDTVVKLFDYKAAIERGSAGEKTDFHHDFVRQVCSQTIKE